MKVAFGKIGRSMPLSLKRCGFGGADHEAISVLTELANRHPDDQFYLVGRNSGERPEEVGLPGNVVNPWLDWADPLRTWMRANHINEGGLDSSDKHIALRNWHHIHTEPLFMQMDGFVLSVGQHGSSNTPLLGVINPNEVTKPHDSFGHYVSFILQGVNAWRDVDPVNREEVYLNHDARNYHKMRDLKWPLRHPVLTLFDFERDLKHERYGDLTPIAPPWRASMEGKLWISKLKNIYARIEPCSTFPGTPIGDMLTYDERWEDRGHFGVMINEAKLLGVKPELSRKLIVKDWVLPLKPTWIHGLWSDASLKELGVDIQGTPFASFNEKYHAVRSTFTTPSSGSGWATTKAWEAFACGSVCFFHPKYDSQNHILKDADPELRDYLRVISAGQLARRVEEMNTDQELWLRIVRKQREHFDRAAVEKRYLTLIEERIWK